MKRDFTLDENVWVFACTGRNERDEDDLSSIELVRLIAQNRHRLVFNSELWGKCQSKLSGLRDSGAFFSSQVLRLLNQIVRDPQTVRWQEDNSDPSYVESQIPEDDRYLVRLAFATASLLVSTDNRLLRVLASIVPNLRAMRPEHVIPLARET